jgi:hypothetical protein
MHVHLRVVMTVDEKDSPADMISEIVAVLKTATEVDKCAIPSRHEGVLKNEAGFPIGAYTYERKR